MSNSYFRFKQFVVRQDRCAMKVGTDGVLLGAWTNVEHAHRILDIGTGTGLISLMLAQRNADASIVALEIDEEAADQAEENVRFSPFSERIDIRRIPFQEFSAKSTQKFDLLVSNPPFFADSLRSPDHSRSLARHSDTLSLEELFCGAKQIATKHARFSVIIPYLQKRRSLFAASDFGWHPARITHVFSLSHSKFPKRILVEFTNDVPDLIFENELTIEIRPKEYSPAYIDLVKEFYLLSST